MAFRPFEVEVEEGGGTVGLEEVGGALPRAEVIQFEILYN